MRGSNIFLIGTSFVGKTPVGDQIAKALGMRRVGASRWIREQYAGPEKILVNGAVCDAADMTHTKEYREAFVNGITALSKSKLGDNPDACVDYLERIERVQEGGCLIEGIRNPRDFALLFRPEIDLVVFLQNVNRPPMSDFERDGCAVIMQTVRWMKDNIIALGRHAVLSFVHVVNNEGLRQLTWRSEGALEVLRADAPEDRISNEAIQEITAWCAKYRVYRLLPQRVQHAIVPIECWVESRVFYNEDPTVTGATQATIVGVSSYKDCALTVTVITKTGAMFSDVPLHRLWQKESVDTDAVRLSLEDLVYKNCPSENVLLAQLPTPNEGRVVATLRKRGIQLEGRYLFTVEWPDDNELHHFVALDNGQYALLPNHKLLFGQPFDAVMPKYLKLRQTWRV